jgi:alkylhydroperoxidase family enzyme
MARIPLVDVPEQIDPATSLPVIPNVYRAFANHPQAAKGLGEFAMAVYLNGSITPAHRELAYLTASVTNDCHY